MGCLKALFVQVGCLVLVLAGTVLAFIYRDQVLAVYRKARGLPPSSEMAFTAPAPGGADVARAALRALGERGGPAFVDVDAAQLAALVDEELSRVPGRAFDSVEVGLEDGAVRLRGLLDLSGVPQRLLGPLAAGFERRERVMAGGPLVVDSLGQVRWSVTALSVRDFPFPRSTIPAILRALKVRGEEGLVPLPVEGRIGDIRVSRERVRLYRGAPS